MCFSFNKYFVEKHKFDELAKSVAQNRILLDINQVSSVPPKQEAVTYEDYLALKNIFAEKVELNYSFLGKLSFMKSVKNAEQAPLTSINSLFIDYRELEELAGENLKKHILRRRKRTKLYI